MQTFEGRKERTQTSMLTRAHLRLKVLQVLYANLAASNKPGVEIEKDLRDAIDQVYGMYIAYLGIITQLLTRAEERIQAARKKKLPTPEDLNPNLKWLKNPVLHQLYLHKELPVLLKKYKIDFANEPILIRDMFKQVASSEVYKTYMSLPEGDYPTEKADLVKIIKTVVINFAPFHHWLKQRSVYNQFDDIDRICSMLLKTIKGFEERTAPILPPYKEEYKDFFITLLRKTREHSSWIEELLKKTVENWEIERFAPLDILLLKMAITEAIEFPSIPLRVTMDEYIEFAKNYSTEKSGAFVNGLLDSALKQLKEAGKIQKTLVAEKAEIEKEIKEN